MTETRLLTALALALIAAGCIVLEIATVSAPPQFEVSWLYLVSASLVLLGAGLGVFAAMVASTMLGLLRGRRAERAADRAAAPPLAPESPRTAAPLSGHRRSARGQRPR